MSEVRHEHSEHLWITTGVSGAAQEASFMNATLQSTASGALDFSVAVHVGVPAEIASEEELHKFLYDVFGVAIQATESVFGVGTLNVEIQLGPEDDDE